MRDARQNKKADPFYDGERLVPAAAECAPDTRIFKEHVARYQFAKRFSRGKVLDVACGTGYGTRILASSKASHVIGVDRNPDAIAYAGSCYAGKKVRFKVMDAGRLEFGAESFDTVVSFETIEHIKKEKGSESLTSKLFKSDSFS